MDANGIIAMIEKHRNQFFDAQIAGSADDPLEYSLASLNRFMADEYESLLLEISTEQ